MSESILSHIGKKVGEEIRKSSGKTQLDDPIIQAMINLTRNASNTFSVNLRANDDLFAVEKDAILQITNISSNVIIFKTEDGITRHLRVVDQVGNNGRNIYERQNDNGDVIDELYSDLWAEIEPTIQETILGSTPAARGVSGDRHKVRILQEGVLVGGWYSVPDMFDDLNVIKSKIEELEARDGGGGGSTDGDATGDTTLNTSPSLDIGDIEAPEDNGSWAVINDGNGFGTKGEEEPVMAYVIDGTWYNVQTGTEVLPSGVSIFKETGVHNEIKTIEEPNIHNATTISGYPYVDAQGYYLWRGHLDFEINGHLIKILISYKIQEDKIGTGVPLIIANHGWTASSTPRVDSIHSNTNHFLNLYAVLAYDWAGDINGNLTDTDTHTIYPPELDRLNFQVNPAGDTVNQASVQTLDDIREMDMYYWQAMPRKVIAYAHDNFIGDINPNKIGFFGYSWGSTIGWTVATDPRIKAFVGWFGAGYRHWFDGQPLLDELDTNFTAGNNLYISTLEPQSHAKKVQCPTFWINGSNDNHGNPRGLNNIKSVPNNNGWWLFYDSTGEIGHGQNNKSDIDDVDKYFFNTHLLQNQLKWYKVPLIEPSLVSTGLNTGYPQVKIIPDEPDDVSDVYVYFTSENEVDSDYRNWEWTKVTATNDGSGHFFAETPVNKIDKYVSAYARIVYTNGTQLSTDITHNIPQELGNAVSIDTKFYKPDEATTANLVAWYDADDANTLFADTSKTTKATSIISCWADKSGNGLDLLQPNAGTNPTINGSIGFRQGVLFDTGTHLNATATNTQIYDVFIIWKFNNSLGLGTFEDPNVTFQSLFSDGTNSGSASNGVIARADANALDFLNNSWLDTTYNNAVTTDTLVGLPTFLSAGLINARSSAETHTSNGLSVSSLKGLQSHGIDATIGEIVVYDSKLSDDERQKIEGYLMHRWGLQSLLDSTHPHKNVPPITYDFQDADGDNVINRDDAFVNDATQWADRDGDGCGDNPDGNNADAFPDDSTQCEDRDGDGYGDNPLGNDPDDFPDDPFEWRDSDGDGVGDNEEAIEQFITIPAGRYNLGIDKNVVTRTAWYPLKYTGKLTKSIEILRTTITRRMWASVMNGNTDGISLNPSYSNYAYFKNLTRSEIENTPVTNVNLFDVKAFLTRLTNKARFNNDINEFEIYDLPTRAELEIAVKGGTDTWFPWGNIYGMVENYPYMNNGQFNCPTPVGAYPPNAYGLYDGNGNVEEWTKDLVGSAYNGKAKTDENYYPQKLQYWDKYYAKEGSYINFWQYSKSAWFDDFYRAGDTFIYRGFRIVKRQTGNIRTPLTIEDSSGNITTPLTTDKEYVGDIVNLSMQYPDGHANESADYICFAGNFKITVGRSTQESYRDWIIYREVDSTNRYVTNVQIRQGNLARETFVLHINPSQGYRADIEIPIKLNEWFHLTYREYGSRTDIWLNGELFHTFRTYEFSTPRIRERKAIQMGLCYENYDVDRSRYEWERTRYYLQNFHCYDFAVFYRNLTESEIKGIYNSHIFPQPDKLFLFDGGTNSQPILSSIGEVKDFTGGNPLIGQSHFRSIGVDKTDIDSDGAYTGEEVFDNRAYLTLTQAELDTYISYPDDKEPTNGSIFRTLVEISAYSSQNYLKANKKKVHAGSIGVIEGTTYNDWKYATMPDGWVFIIQESRISPSDTNPNDPNYNLYEKIAPIDTTLDSDEDTVPDYLDDFPFDATETTDTDGDGVGDNSDAFINDISEWIDSDGDLVGDNSDQLPFNPYETTDADNDGLGSNEDINDANADVRSVYTYARTSMRRTLAWQLADTPSFPSTNDAYSDAEALLRYEYNILMLGAKNTSGTTVKFYGFGKNYKAPRYLRLGGASSKSSYIDEEQDWILIGVNSVNDKLGLYIVSADPYKTRKAYTLIYNEANSEYELHTPSSDPIVLESSRVQLPHGQTYTVIEQSNNVNGDIERKYLWDALPESSFSFIAYLQNVADLNRNTLFAEIAFSDIDSDWVGYSAINQFATFNTNDVEQKGTLIKISNIVTSTTDVVIHYEILEQTDPITYSATKTFVLSDYWTNQNFWITDYEYLETGLKDRGNIFDSDGDGVEDEVDPDYQDDDEDGVINKDDDAPSDPNVQKDHDSDGVDNSIDPDWIDVDEDGILDSLDPDFIDSDNDLVPLVNDPDDTDPYHRWSGEFNPNDLIRCEEGEIANGLPDGQLTDIEAVLNLQDFYNFQFWTNGWRGNFYLKIGDSVSGTNVIDKAQYLQVVGKGKITVGSAMDPLYVDEDGNYVVVYLDSWGRQIDPDTYPHGYTSQALTNPDYVESIEVNAIEVVITDPSAELEGRKTWWIYYNPNTQSYRAWRQSSTSRASGIDLGNRLDGTNGNGNIYRRAHVTEDPNYTARGQYTMSYLNPIFYWNKLDTDVNELLRPYNHWQNSEAYYERVAPLIGKYLIFGDSQILPENTIIKVSSFKSSTLVYTSSTLSQTRIYRLYLRYYDVDRFTGATIGAEKRFNLDAEWDSWTKPFMGEFELINASDHGN